MANKQDDESYEKPSRRGLWNERSRRPVAARTMTKAEIEEHRQLLVASYQCEDSDIIFDFQKITDENDEDRDDCIWLKYKLKMGPPSQSGGAVPTREIFNIKLPIPDDIRRMAETLRRQQTDRTKTTKLMALPAPESSEPRAATVATAGQPPAAEVGLKLRKPVKRRIIKQ